MASSQNAGSGARDKVPNDPTDLSGSSWLTAGRRALKEYKADDLQDRAAALTYFGIQSIFPGLLPWSPCSAFLASRPLSHSSPTWGKAAPSLVRVPAPGSRGRDL
jgi:membrane protein